MDKFTVINTSSDNDNKMSKTQRILFLFNSWYRQCEMSLRDAEQKNVKDISDCSQEDLMKIVFAGVKFICSLREVRREHERLDAEYWKPLEVSNVWYPLMQLIFAMMGHLKLKNFVTIFPITKDFDGEKWGCKDYFYTMDVLSGMDLEKPIGTSKDVSNLLWDYQNDDLRHAYVEYTSAMSDMYRAQTGKGIMEQWCEDNSIDTYSVDQTAGIIKNNQTGEISKISKKPSYLSVVK